MAQERSKGVEMPPLCNTYQCLCCGDEDKNCPNKTPKRRFDGCMKCNGPTPSCTKCATCVFCFVDKNPNCEYCSDLQTVCEDCHPNATTNNGLNDMD